MLDTTLLEQNTLSPSFGGSFSEPNSFNSNGIDYLTERFLNPNHELALNSERDIDSYFINQELEEVGAIDVFNTNSGSTSTAVEALTVDPLTGEALAGTTVYSASSSNTYSLQEGSLRAEQFTLQSGFNYIISGNGNIDFGDGYRDFIDLSGIFSSTVNFNLTGINGNGVLVNPGNGTRVFDAMTLSNGNQILFEGIDSIRFADGTINLSVTPNDPGFNSQWNLHMMGVHNAWRFTTGSEQVLVGVQDTGLGVDSSGNLHPDLGRTLYYADNVSDDFFRNISDQQYGPKDSSHGTGVQGIIGANTNNGYGMSGINWNSNIFNVDVLDGNSGDQTLATATQNMIDYANSQGQRLVINMSLGGGSIDPVFEQLVANNQSSALFVIASGNDNNSAISNPASLANAYSNVIAVGASWGTNDAFGNSTTVGERVSYPSQGIDWWGSNYGYGLTLMGPTEVISTKASPSGHDFYDGQLTSQGTLDIFNGTSAAAPNVAGVASLVWSANPYLSAVQVQDILSQTAYDLGTQGYDLEYGHGFVNADAAVRRAMALAITGASSSTFSFSDGPLNGSLSGSDALAEDNNAYIASADLDESTTEAVDKSELAQAVVEYLSDLASSRSIVDRPELIADNKVELGETSLTESSSLKDAASSSALLNTLELGNAAKVPEDAYSADYDSLTGMTSISKLAKLSGELSDVLAPGIII